MIPLSVLDLSPIVQGGTPALAFRRTLELAQHAERLGYTRFWLAEHHNMPGIGSAATAVLIGHVGAGTSRIRIGAGGSCCRTTRLCRWPNSLARWSRCSPAASISAWAPLRARTGPPRWPFG